jgi:RNA polymerase sigma factor (sigma-70 family)
MQPDDQELIARFLQGESEAVRGIDGWIARAAGPFKRRLTSQWDDVLQDIRLEVTRLLRQDAFRGEASLKTYLWRMVNHLCIDKIRAQAKWQWVELDSLIERGGPAGDSPLQHVLQKESGHMLWRVLGEMSQECRRLWQMILDGLSYQQMSQRLNISEGALRVRVMRCRKQAVAARDQLLGQKQGA